MRCAGGFDFVMVIAVPPVFVILTVVVTVAPMRIAPRYVAVRLTDRCAPGVALAETGTLTVRVPGAAASELNWIVPVNTPPARGVKVTVATTLPPGGIGVPAGGISSTVKFDDGGGTEPPLTCSTVAPTFENAIDAEIGLPPIATPPRLNWPGNTARSPVASCPKPSSATGTSPPPATAAVTVPLSSARALGVKVTGTVSVSPVARVAGSGIDGVPAVKVEPVTASESSVSERVAWNVTDCVVEWPTTVFAKNSELGVGASGSSTGDPNPSTWPSRVPT